MNNNLEEYRKKHSALASQAGFNFQFLAFLYILVAYLKKDDIIKYEQEDDISRCTAEDITILIQVKFGVLTEDGTDPKVTLLDEDIWKTIGIWLNQAQLSSDSYFFIKHRFQIWTNKDVNGNEFLSKILAFSENSIKLIDIRNELDYLYTKTKNESVKLVIKKMEELSDENLSTFCKYFKCERFEGISIIDKIQKSLVDERNIPKNYAEQVFIELSGHMLVDNFRSEYLHEKIEFSWVDVKKKYNGILSMSQKRNLELNRDIGAFMPDSICSDTFVKQLLDIKVISHTDEEKIRNLYWKRCFTTTNLLEQATNISETEWADLDREAMNRWEQLFDKSCFKFKLKSSIKEKEVLFAANGCYFDVMGYNLATPIFQQDLEFSQGYFLNLSDGPVIGWRFDWKEKYGKKK